MRAKFDLPKAFVLALLAFCIGLGVREAHATWGPDANTNLWRGFSTQNTAVVAADTVINNGVYDSNAGTWVRMEGTGGAITAAGCPTTNTDKQDVSTSAAVPSSALSNRISLCVFNQSSSLTVYCTDNNPATATNGAMLEPRTGRCFGGNTQYCVAIGGTASIDYTECAP